MPEDASPRLPGRPADDDVVTMVSALEWQRDHVSRRGAPVASQVLAAVVDDLGGPRVLGPLIEPSVRFGDFPGLRVMAAAHRLALERRSPAVALHLPTLGGTPPVGVHAEERFRAAVVEALAEHPEVLLASLAHTPQTNETGRAPLLRCALSRQPTGLPVRLREMGASAGLNLRADHLPGVTTLEAGPLPRVLDRRGCDLHPIDPLSGEGRLALSSYVWVDDVDRFARLGQALEVARAVPAEVVAQDAGDFVEELGLVDGTTTVVWHSAFWLYLDEGTRIRIDAALESLGRHAGERCRLVHASWEWQGLGDSDASFALSVREWTGAAADGQTRVLVRGDSHGTAGTLQPMD